MNWKPIDDGLESVRNDPAASDVHGHLDVLKKYAAGKSVVEFGVYDGSTTWALLAGRPSVMRSYDVVKQPQVADIEAAVAESGAPWAFVLRNSLVADIGVVDVLFIDTLHTYAQLQAELHIHANSVREAILMHDTVKFGQTDQFNQLPGMWQAVEEFLTDHPEWELAEHYTHCNGLAVLRRLTPLP